MRNAFVRLVAAAGFVMLAGCSQAPPPKAEVKQYNATGEIMALDPAAQTAKIKAGKIEGWMDAMTMDFPVKNKGEFEKLRVGEKIQGVVTVQGTDYSLSGITEVPAAAK